MPTSTCLPSPELADQLVELARLEWTPGATAAAAERFGWTPVQDEECHLPFCYYYEADDFDEELATGGLNGNIDWLEKHYAHDPGWRFERDSGRAHFDAQWRAAVALFTQRLGKPEVTVRHEKGKSPWYYAAWRCAGNALVVGQCTDSGSYMTFEQALVWIAPYPAGRPFPGAGGFDSLIEC